MTRIIISNSLVCHAAPNVVFISSHNYVIKWKPFPRYWPFVQGIHRSPVNSHHKGQCRGALRFSFIWAWINGWVNNRYLIPYGAHYDVTVMKHRYCNVLLMLLMHMVIISSLLFVIAVLIYMDEKSLRINAWSQDYAVTWEHFPHRLHGLCE